MLDNDKNVPLKKLIIKYGVISYVVTWIITNHLVEILNNIVDLIFEPLFSISVDKDGKPDKKHIKNFTLKIGIYTFPIGEMLYALFRLIIYIIIAYYLVTAIVYYTDLLNI